MNRFEREQEAKQKAFEERNQDRLQAQRQQYNEDFIVITYPSQKEIEKHVREEYDLLQRLKNKRYGTTSSQ